VKSRQLLGIEMKPGRLACTASVLPLSMTNTTSSLYWHVLHKRVLKCLSHAASSHSVYVPSELH